MLTDCRYDCVLVDLNLPDGQGIEVVDALRDTTCPTALIVLTGSDDTVFPLTAIQHGADDYFFKSDLSTQGLRRSVTYAVERARSNAALKRISAQSAAVMTALDDGLAVFDGQGSLISANPAIERIVGAPSSDLIGRSITELPCEFIDAEGNALDNEAISKNLLRDNPRRGLICQVRRRDATASWVEVNIHPLLIEGAVDGVVICARDITARLMSEEATRFQAALLGAVGQAIVATDKNGVILYWNKVAEENYGLDEATALNRSMWELVPHEFSAHAQQVMAAVAAGQTWSGDFEAPRRDGSVFPALVTTTPIFDEEGNVEGMIEVLVDITERKRAEEAAQALSVIVESTPDAILTAAVDGTILTWNRGAEELYGYPIEEAIGSHIHILDPDGSDHVFRSTVALVENGGTSKDVEMTRRRRDGSLVSVSATISPIRGRTGEVVGVASIGRDISDRKRLEKELSDQALHDSLTGLPNRTLLADRLSQTLATADRRSTTVSVLFLDLDQFKMVNDGSGHLIGDRLLVEVARRLKAAIRPSDTLARFGGDEFVVVCGDADVNEARRIADRLSAALRDPINIGGNLYYVSASVGIAVSPPLQADPDILLRYADIAMYEAKAGGRSRARVFDDVMAIESQDKLELTKDLRQALRDNALEVHFQPVIDLATGRLMGLEALTRWHHPARGWIPPVKFVPLAEENGLIATLDQWVLNNACSGASELRAAGLLPEDCTLSVNISARNVADLGLIGWVRDAARSASYPLGSLEVEVTETAILAEIPTIQTVLEGLRSLGVGIALDDFGTGYSSLTFIRQLPVTTVKIDRSFIRHIPRKRDDLAIVSSVIDLARAVGLNTVAEGVETREQLNALHRLGCQKGQGFLWSSALPARDLSLRLEGDPEEFAFASNASGWRSGRHYGPGRFIQNQKRKPMASR